MIYLISNSGHTGKNMLDSEYTKKVLKILEQQYGNSTTALEYGNTFQLLVSTMLAAQSTDKQVNKITRNLFLKYPDAKSFIQMSLDELEARIKSVGLYKNKAKNILASANIIAQKFNGIVPKNRDKLVKLPGVGRKTANVVLSVGFQYDAIAVDTHVFRVSNRIGLAEASNVEKTEKHLMKNIPKNKWSAAHHWLIWHGRKVCKARNPKCDICPISKYCRFIKTKTSQTVKPLDSGIKLS